MAESQAAFAVKFLRGSEAANDIYTGPEGELSIDLSNWRIRIHDGVTAGGHAISNLNDLTAVKDELAAAITNATGDGFLDQGQLEEPITLSQLIARVETLEQEAVGGGTLAELRWAPTASPDYGVHSEETPVELSVQAQYIYNNENITYTLNRGTLPVNFNIDSSNPNAVLLKGTTPTSKGLTSYNFDITATAGGSTITLNSTLSVDGENQPPVWQTSANLGELAEGALDLQLQATDPDGVDSALTYELVTGMLPEGVTLGTDGRLTGTVPTSDSTYTFTVRANDEDSGVQRSFTLTTPKVFVNYPGPAIISGGTEAAGYFGVISDFVTGTELASQIGLTSGTVQTDSTDWFKFSYNGRPYLWPKKTLRNRVPWEDLYDLGAVGSPVGDPDYKDITPLPGQTVVAQDTVVVIDGITYKIRLPAGASGLSVASAQLSGFDVTDTHDSEWNKLFYHIMAYTASNDDQDIRASEGYALEENGTWDQQYNFGMGIGAVASHLDGRSIWCQEHVTGNSQLRLVRGREGITYASSFDGSYINPGFGWRPVLVGMD